MITKLPAQLGSYNPYERSVDVMASTSNPTLAYDETGAPILESLVGWDLERFTKNPVVLWGHDSFCPPIGKASDLEVTPDGGLKMKVTLLHPGVSDLADQVAGSLQDDVLRAVSVGFSPGASTKNADGSWTRTNNELLELSFVSLPADEDAGTPELNPEAAEEEKRKAVSAAASALAKHRVASKAAKKLAERKAAEAAATETKTDGGEHQRFDVGGRLDRAKRTSIGGAYINARVSRTGVLRYHLPDGTVRRELRHPAEVFKADSLATLDSVPVIDIRDHTAILTPADYKRAAVGHVKSFRADGKFISCELVVQDEATLDAIDSGDRAEISCGYTCKHDWTPGTFDGEPYDLVQRDINYNHVALCPPNRGRAGPEVGLRLDNQTDSRWGVCRIDSEDSPMATNTNEETMTTKIRLDSTDYIVGSSEHHAKLDSMHKAEVAKVTADLTAAAQVKLDALETAKAVEAKRADEAQAKLDAATTELEAFKADAAKAKTKAAEDAEKEKAARVAQSKSRRTLERMFRFFVAADDNDDEDDDDKESKMDSMSDRELMLAGIQKAVPTFDATDKSDDYVRARFDAECEKAKAGRSVDAVARAAFLGTKHLDATTATFDAIDKARKVRDDAALNAWKPKAS